MDYFGIPGSPVLSELKNAVKEAIFDGRIPNERDAAWAYLLEIAPRPTALPSLGNDAHTVL